MSTKHTVTLPDGTTATRASANRVYPFAVAIAPETKGERIAKLRDRIAHSAELVVDYTLVVDYLKNGGELVTIEGTYSSSTYAVNLKPGKSGGSYDEQKRGMRRFIDDTREAIQARYEGYIAGQLETIAKAKAELITTAAGPELVGEWKLSGWQSRADLAAAEQRKVSGYYPNRAAAVILESTYITK